MELPEVGCCMLGVGPVHLRQGAAATDLRVAGQEGAEALTILHLHPHDHYEDVRHEGETSSDTLLQCSNCICVT